MSDDDNVEEVEEDYGDDEKYVELMERIAELEEENRRLKLNGAVEGGQGGSRQVPLQIGNKVKKFILRGKTDQIQKLIQENAITVNDTLLLEEGEFFGEDIIDDETTMTLLEYAALSGQYEVCSLLLNLGVNPNEEEVDEMVDKVADAGHIHIAVLLGSSQITGAGGAEVKDILQRLGRQNGIMREFLSSLSKDENVKTFIDIMEKNVIECIEKEVGFSDDFLNLLFFYHTKIEKKSFIETDLFAAINKKCTEIINNKSIKNWYFFKQYIMASTIWMRDGVSTGYDDLNPAEDEEEEEAPEQEEEEEKKDEEKYLFYQLLKIVNDGFEDKIKAKLQAPFKKIAEDNPDDWKALCSFDVESTLEDRCRQDLVPNGVKPDYTHRELTQYVPSSTSFNAYQHYDVNEYLSKLLLTAHTVDKEFHESIQEIFKINLRTNISEIKELNGMEYQKGPVKLISRCKAKAETDYANEPFPSSACILDMNRCALVFEDISSMLKALDLMKNKISYYQSGNIVAICRDKNGFAVYNHDKPDYADIKLNVLIKGVKYNVIGEVQFMLRAMMNFKHSVHSLYSVIRRKEFVDDFVKILPYRNTPEIELMRAAGMVDYNALCDLIVTHGWNSERIMMGIKEDGSTILSLIFKNLHIKEKEKAAIRCFKLLLNNVDKELIEENLYDANGTLEDDGADGVFALGHHEMMKLLFSQFSSFETKLRETEDLATTCAAMLTLYPEPTQFKNLVDILGIKEDEVKEWVKKPELLMMPLLSRQEENVKYALSLFPSKTAQIKLLNAPIDEEDEETTLLMAVLGLGSAIKTLLMAFDPKDRVDLIDKGDLIMLSIGLEKPEISRSIIEAIDPLPEQQLKYLTQTYNDVTLVQLAEEMEAPKLAAWIEKKIASLQ